MGLNSGDLLVQCGSLRTLFGRSSFAATTVQGIGTLETFEMRHPERGRRSRCR